MWAARYDALTEAAEICRSGSIGRVADNEKRKEAERLEKLILALRDSPAVQDDAPAIDPFNCPKCGAHDWGLNAPHCPHCGYGTARSETPPHPASEAGRKLADEIEQAFRVRVEHATDAGRNITLDENDIKVLVAALRADGGGEKDAARYRWLRDRMTFCNTHPRGRPVLYDTNARLWYHATDDLQTETLDAAIDAAMLAAAPSPSGDKESR